MKPPVGGLDDAGACAGVAPVAGAALAAAVLAGPAAALAMAGAATAPAPRPAIALRAARSRTTRHFGSRSFRIARIGVAMKIDE